ncbi:MAG: isoprenylcysteine carboxylmethyltransferase family protein [Dyadobacter sp.]|uniref:methyltransferase family protein n=1 Tax=Dyadobacter sp. TaxID=1914288 RepID=UPI003266407D
MYTSIIAACWITFILVWLVMGGLAKKNINRKRHLSGPTVWTVIVIAIVAFLLHTERFKYLITYHLFPSTPFIQYMGVFICAAGIAFAIWARIHLGKNWGMPMSLKEKPDLITTGPYHFVRHPIYTGLLAAILGTNIGGSFMTLIWLLLAAIFFIYSAKKEEKMMLLQFPDEYPAYMQRSKMLIPFIF